jgi:hypothetical protein
LAPASTRAFDGFEIAFPCSEDECGHAAAVFHLVAITEKFRGIGDVVTTGDATFGCVPRAIGGRGSWSGTATRTFSASATSCARVAAKLIAAGEPLRG